MVVVNRKCLLVGYTRSLRSNSKRVCNFTVHIQPLPWHLSRQRKDPSLQLQRPSAHNRYTVRQQRLLTQYTLQAFSDASTHDHERTYGGGLT